MKQFDQNVDGYYDVENQLPRYLRELADDQFDRAQAERDKIDSVSAFEAHRDRMQSNFRDAIGGLPDTNSDLDPERTGTLDRDGFSIETVVFESLPNFHVTTNLYLPQAASEDTQRPAVLFLCGHSATGKAAPVYQQVCVDLVRNGFVVLAVDPVGQGERHQFYNPETGELPRQNIVEHSYMGHQCAAIGANVARYFVHDGIRALDYLLDRPEVDSDRVGVTGNSGGGMQTGYLMLVEERLDAAAPCCFVTSKEDYMETGQGQDGEQVLARAIERGPRYDDFVSAFAPRPALIGAAQSDFLCIEGVHRTYDRASTVYEHYDAASALELTIAPETHGFSPHLREAAVNWFRQHLDDAPPDFETDDPSTVDPAALQCTAEGEVLAAYPDEQTVTDLNRRYVTATTSNPVSAPDPADPEMYARSMRESVVKRFGLDHDRGELFPRTYDAETVNGVTWKKVFFLAERDPPIIVTGIVATDEPDQIGVREPLILLYDKGTTVVPERTEQIEDRVDDHGVVVAFDPRGVGAVRPREVNTPLMNGGGYGDYHGTEHKLAADALMLGTSLVAQQTADILLAGDYLTKRFEEDVDLAIEGHGTSSYHACLAAVADPSFRTIRLVDPVASFHDRATGREVEIEHRLLVDDVVGSYDFPQLLAALDNRTLHWEGAEPGAYR
ncbi:alpha/beta hydrolase family protein [Halorussus salinisoli]|uniref:alpha/beta hydrolase family protein n=1 Tax=Halorussus salinisoli TaxID=2558242 RepID=UPI0010C1F3CD|nr:prolyl oligopeptidase family serine peptidase [Halorussus salinisoli]